MYYYLKNHPIIIQIILFKNIWLNVVKPSNGVACQPLRGKKVWGWGRIGMEVGSAELVGVKGLWGIGKGDNAK